MSALAKNAGRMARLSSTSKLTRSPKNPHSESGPNNSKLTLPKAGSCYSPTNSSRCRCSLRGMAQSGHRERLAPDNRISSARRAPSGEGSTLIGIATGRSPNPRRQLTRVPRSILDDCSPFRAGLRDKCLDVTARQQFEWSVDVLAEIELRTCWFAPTVEPSGTDKICNFITE